MTSRMFATEAMQVDPGSEGVTRVSPDVRRHASEAMMDEPVTPRGLGREVIVAPERID